MYSKNLKKAAIANAIIVAISMTNPTYAIDYNVTSPFDDGLGTTPNTLSWAILQANTVSPETDTITLNTDVTILSVMKTLLNSDIILKSDDTHRTISGRNQYRPLFVKSGNITIQNLTLANGTAKGGDSFSGGGGAGLGGALFVYDGTVMVDNVSFNNNKAIGGSSGISPFSEGAGGMFGDASSFAGGGLFASSFNDSGAYGGTGNYGGAAESFGGGGHYGADTFGNGGFGGGGSAGSHNFYYSYYGGYIAYPSHGGSGGFGGGGGSGYNAGDGGFGGGAGAGFSSAYAGFGGGSGGGYHSHGGGGAGFGGAIFAMKGSLTLNNVSFNSNSVLAGTGANSGTADAGDVFICTSDLGGYTTASCNAIVNACGTTSSSQIIGNFQSDCPIELSILDVPNSVEQGTTFTATFEFTESVSDFTIEDITVINGSATNFSGSGVSYKADITADGNGDLTINVPEHTVYKLVSTPITVSLVSNSAVALIPILQMLLLDE